MVPLYYEHLNSSLLLWEFLNNTSYSMGNKTYVKIKNTLKVNFIKTELLIN